MFLSRLRLIERSPRAVGSTLSWSESCVDHPLWSWSCEPIEYSSRDIFAGSVESSVPVLVVMKSCHEGGSMVSSHEEFVSLDHVVRENLLLLPHVGREGKIQRDQKRGQSSTRGVDLGASASTAHMQEDITKESMSEDGASGESTGDEGTEGDKTEEKYTAVFRELEASRAEIAAEWAPTETAHATKFTLQVQGGAWQVERTGRSLYGVRCFAKRNTTAEHMCRAFHLKMSAAFEFNVHGEAMASALGRLWVHRMSWLRDAWEASGMALAFPFGSLGEFEPPENISHLLSSANAKSLERHAAIASLLPSGSS
eukprot:6486913-Amphidinium_carterae.1